VIFEDRITIDAEAPRVWDFLLDVNAVSACMPGVENVTLVDDRTFDGIIAASVGPIAGKFLFRAHILESDPPRELTAEIDGTDSVTKSTVTGQMAMRLEPLAATQTALAYRASIDIHGRLAILGEMVLRATAALMVEEFTKRLRRELEKTPST
jgi:carbon monoxide dehydrogenase subunit G